VQIVYSVETELLGTAGAIKSARSFIEDTFLVLNGDTYLEVDLPGLIDFHRNRRLEDLRTIGTIATIDVDDSTSYGKIALNDEARILGFEEKVEAGPAWINGGVYVLEPAILDLIPTGRVVSAERETFPLVLRRNLRMFGYPVQGFFVDIGTPEGYRRFCSYVEEQGR
jgi:mannose-1-phosphate guanylyltransferase